MSNLMCSLVCQTLEESILNEKQETTTKVIWCLWKIHVLVFYTELP